MKNSVADRFSALAKNPWLASGGLVILAVAAVTLVAHLYASRHYGYFIDELYYIACTHHLAWGYVDQPPLVVFLARFSSLFFGDSLAAIRLFPLLAGVGKVILTGLLAREMGGGRFAQGLAALCSLVAPGFLGLDNFLSMNPYEPLFWLGCAFFMLRIARTGNQKLWLWVGVISGLGLLNKHSMGIFGVGMVVGILLTADRKSFRSPWIWLGALIAFVIFLPNLIWNIENHFPFLELQANIRHDGRNVSLPLLTLLSQETLALLPLSLPIWLAGFWYFFFTAKGKPYRAVGWACVVTFVLIFVLNPRIYYFWPAVPLLFASGSVLWESWLSAPRWKWLRVAYPILMLVLGAVLAPMMLPVLPVETYMRYAEVTHIAPPAIEKWKTGPLPQLYASQFGWEEMVAEVARVYNSLPPDVRPKTAIFAQNYGQAGAIDLFGPRYGLPKAICGHQNYFLWGPRDYTGESVIVMQGRQKELEKVYDSVEFRGHYEHPYSMPRDHIDIFYCRGLKAPLKQVWPSVKNWH